MPEFDVFPTVPSLGPQAILKTLFEGRAAVAATPNEFMLDCNAWPLSPKDQSLMLNLTGLTGGNLLITATPWSDHKAEGTGLGSQAVVKSDIVADGQHDLSEIAALCRVSPYVHVKVEVEESSDTVSLDLIIQAKRTVVAPESVAANQAAATGAGLGAANASGTSVNASGFSGVLSNADTDVQKALATLDQGDSFPLLIPSTEREGSAITVKNGVTVGIDASMTAKVTAREVLAAVQQHSTAEFKPPFKYFMKKVPGTYGAGNLDPAAEKLSFNCDDANQTIVYRMKVQGLNSSDVYVDSVEAESYVLVQDIDDAYCPAP
jgi:hypothetical protein